MRMTKATREALERTRAELKDRLAHFGQKIEALEEEKTAASKRYARIMGLITDISADLVPEEEDPHSIGGKPVQQAKTWDASLSEIRRKAEDRSSAFDVGKILSPHGHYTMFPSAGSEDGKAAAAGIEAARRNEGAAAADRARDLGILETLLQRAGVPSEAFSEAATIWISVGGTITFEDLENGLSLTFHRK